MSRLIDADKLIQEMSEWYWDKEKAIACEKGHKTLEGATFVGEYKPKGMVGDGYPIKIRVKFKGSDKWVVYKR